MLDRIFRPRFRRLVKLRTEGLRPASRSAKAEAAPEADSADFLRVVKEQVNSLYFALQQRQFSGLAELAGSLRQTANASGYGDLCAAATRLEELAERQALEEIEDTICELAALSESIALQSHKPVEQISELELKPGEQADLMTPAALSPSRNAQQCRPPLVSSLPMDDPDFRRIVTGFIKRLREQAVAMQAAWERGDLDELASLSHWLKGAGGTVGFDAFTDPAKKLELLARQEQVDKIGDALATYLE